MYQTKNTGRLESCEHNKAESLKGFGSGQSGVSETKMHFHSWMFLVGTPGDI